ncbi:MAG TPA: methyltransferase domain-containing protein [Thermoanaerobaculia bacterium]|nr:methyltransferase domain-containing protein [Thermoanaerobaculia bacterium]
MTRGDPPPRAIDIATRATVVLVTACLRAPARVLEIGCGGGDVAADLRDLGYSMKAIESDAHRVAEARAKGIDAICGVWPEVDYSECDAVLFSRSLHHITDLHGAVKAARTAAGDNGLLLVDDFDFHSADPRTIEWIAFKVREANEGGMIVSEAVEEFATSLLHAPDPVVAWHSGHDDDLHSPSEMLAAIAELFVVESVEDVPYAFRYLIPVLDDTPAAVVWVRDMMEQERRLGEIGNIRLIGRKVVARAGSTLQANAHHKL